MKDTPQLLSVKRVRKWGSSYVLMLDKLVREVLKCKPGDWVAFRKVGPYLVIALERADVVVPLSEEEKRQGVAALRA